MLDRFFYPVAGTILVLVIATFPVNSWEPENEAKNSIPFLNDDISSPTEMFWKGVHREEYVTKLNSLDFEKFIGEHSDTFIMFYANWCKYSVEAKGEFAKAAQEIAYTEGFNSVHFGALDCNATLENKKICNKTFKVTTYPRFLYFRNGGLDRMYTVKCPRYSEFFYNWIVYNGDEKYCSGSASSLAMATATSSSGLSSSTMRISYLLSFCVTILFYGFSNKVQSL